MESQGRAGSGGDGSPTGRARRDRGRLGIACGPVQLGASPPRFAETAEFALLEADVFALAHAGAERAEVGEDEAAAARAEGGDGEPCLGVISAQILACPGGLALVDAARTVLGRRKGEAAAQNKANEAMAAIQLATELGKAWHFEECMGDDGAVSSEGCAILMLPTAGMDAFAAAHESFYEAKKVKGHVGEKTSEQLVSAGADSDCIAIRFQFDFDFDSISIRFRFDSAGQQFFKYSDDMFFECARATVRRWLLQCAAAAGPVEKQAPCRLLHPPSPLPPSFHHSCSTRRPWRSAPYRGTVVPWRRPRSSRGLWASLSGGRSRTPLTRRPLV